MADRLMGQETEYAIAGRDLAGNRLSPSMLVEPLYAVALKTLPHLPNGNGSGIFIASGGRFYVDAGAHPELTTPECPNPWDVARYIKAGERILVALAADVSGIRSDVKDVSIFRSNVDYSGSRSSWGCHESYLHRCLDMELMRHEIVPHLCSRIIFTGSGGFDPHAPGLTFLVSPRVAHLEREVSEDTTHVRGIFNTRQEHHATSDYRRLHLVCGESLFSETAMFLKAGTTMLVVAMIENGLLPGNQVRPRSPLDAMRRFAHDPTCRVQAILMDGRLASAVEIQRHYLGYAERHLCEPWMPPWAAEVCRQWSAILDRLDTGAPASVAMTLDWAIKYALFNDRLTRHGQSFESIRRWAPVLDQLMERFSVGKETIAMPTANDLFGPGNGMKPHLDELNPTVRRRGLSWDNLPAVLAVRQQLFEVDVRCSQLGPAGVLAALDNAGVLSHHFPGVDNIEHAQTNPPSIGRARLRGHCIKRFAGNKDDYACDWSGIWNGREKRFLDLAEPFTAVENWRALPAEERPHIHSMFDELGTMLDHVGGLYETGNFTVAQQHLRTVERYRDMLDDHMRYRYFRYRAWLRSRFGFLDGIALLDEIARSRPLSMELITDYLCVYRFQGLTPPSAIDGWIRRGQEWLQQNPATGHDVVAAFLGHHGYTLVRRGQAAEARAILEQSLQHREEVQRHVLGRILADLGEANRILGDRQSAQRWLDESQEIQTAHHCESNLADFTYTYRAKLSEHREESLEWLQKVIATQERFNNLLGKARTLVLMARFANDSAAAAELKQQVELVRAHVPSLQSCALLEKILTHWNKWTGPDKQPDEHGDFFWGV